MKNKLLSIQHIIVAVILLTKGFDKIQHHYSLIGWTILLLGVTVLAFFIFLKVSKKPHSTLEVIIHFFESIALFLTSYVYFQEGKSSLPYVTMIAGIGFLIATIVHLKGHKKEVKVDERKTKENDLYKMDGLKIETYSNKYQEEIQKLILKIQQTEFNIDIDLERQADLCNISNYYQQGLGNFWVALFNGKVVGTISLLDIGDKQSALRKMFVDSNFRGKEHKVGQKLLETLIENSKTSGVKEIYLGTTEKFIAAQRFYEKNNFIEIEKNSLPKYFPIMEVDVKFYKLIL